MTRRHFLRNVLGLTVGMTLSRSIALEWDDLDMTLTQPDTLRYQSLFGIPYHQTDASTGQWLGLPRGEDVTRDILHLIRLMEDDKRT